jgi:parvulin-like peptidyl-prolyl isomerase
MRFASFGLVVMVTCAVALADAPIGAVAIVDKVVAVVGGDVLWQSAVDERMAPHKPKDRPEVIEEMINEMIFVRAARKAGITVEKSEVLAALDEIKAQNSLDDAKLDAALKLQGYTRERYLVELANQLIRLRAQNQFISMQITVEDSEIDAEAKARGMTLPLGSTEKEDVRQKLKRARVDRETVKWLETQKRLLHIERRR